jgi:hypothetical protein
MASQAAYMVEKAVGHGKENIKQDVSKYEGVDDPNETMKALVWQGKQKVEVGGWPRTPDPRLRIH